MASSDPLTSIKGFLRDILGSEASTDFSDDFLESYIRRFGGRVDAVQCALESLIEEYYNKTNAQMRRGADLAPELLQSPREFFKLPFFKKVCTLLLHHYTVQNIVVTPTEHDHIISLAVYFSNIPSLLPVVALFAGFAVSWYL